MAEGGCHCGAVRYAVEGAPERSTLCHCTDCRRCAGAPMVAWGTWPRDRVRVTRGTPAVYGSSPAVRRSFCAACGTGLFFANDETAAGTVDVQTATLDDPDAFPPTDHIQTAERIDWMATAHTLPAYERWSPGSADGA